VSSASIMGKALCSTALGKSFILRYTKNNNGPRIEPCSTPHFILVHFEVVVVFIMKNSKVYCVISVCSCSVIISKSYIF
jgi:hypothetical protein